MLFSKTRSLKIIKYYIKNLLNVLVYTTQCVLNRISNFAIFFSFRLIFLFVFCRFGWICCESINEWFVQIILMFKEVICQIIVSETILESTIFNRENVSAQLLVERWEVWVMEMNLIFYRLTQQWEHHRHCSIHQRWRIHNMNFHVFYRQKISFCRSHLHISRREPLHHLPRVSKINQNIQHQQPFIVSAVQLTHSCRSKQQFHFQ